MGLGRCHHEQTFTVAEDALDEPDPDDGAYEPDVRSYELPVPAGGAGAYACVG